MPTLKIKIDNKDIELECGDGEEGLLREAEQRINLKLKKHQELQSLSESKKYLMIALILISEKIVYENKDKENQLYFKEIIKELEKLDEILK